MTEVVVSVTPPFPSFKPIPPRAKNYNSQNASSVWPAPVRTRSEAAGFESAALLLTPYWGRRRVGESYGGGGSGWTCSLAVVLPQPPSNLTASIAALNLLTVLGRIRSRVPASRPTVLFSTSERIWSQHRSASGAAQSSSGRRGRPEPLPGEPRLRRRKSPPDATGVCFCPPPPLPLSPGPSLATAPAAEAAAAAALFSTAGALRPAWLLSPSGRLSSSSRSSPFSSPSSSRHPSPTPPEPGASAAPGHGVRSHSEKDSGFRPAVEPGVPEAEAMCAIVGAHLGRCLSVVGGRGHCRLLLGCGRLAAEVSPNGAIPLRRRLLPPHHRWDPAPRPPG